MADKPMSRFALVFACLFSVVISGCAEIKYGRPLTPAYKRSIKKMAVVSTMGDTFKAMKSGTYGVTSAVIAYDFSDFGMDDKLEEAVSRYLQGQSAIQALARPDLREGLNGAFDYDWNSEKAIEQAGPYLKDLREQGIDALLVISQGKQLYGSGLMRRTGYGLFVSMVLFGAASAEDVYLVPKFTLMDTHSEKVILDRFDILKEYIKISKWQTSFSDYSQDEQRAMKDALIKLIDEDTIASLKTCKF